MRLFNKNPDFSKKILYFFFFSLSVFFIFLFLFFINLFSTLSEFAAGDACYHHQLLYNFLHGRIFQTSLYHIFGNITYNPYPYICQFADHVNFTHYIFSIFYAILPNIYGLYLPVFIFVYLGLCYYSLKIFRRLSPEQYKDKFLIFMSLFLISTFLVVIQYKAHPILYGGPFFFAAYYYLITKDRLKYILSVIALCLVSEDLALFFATFSCYVYIFEPEHRKFASLSFILSVFWVLLVTLVIQPAVRYDTFTASSSFTSFKLAKIIKNNFAISMPNFSRQLIRWVIFLPSLIFAAAAFYVNTRTINWKRILGLIFIAPVSTWFIGTFDFFSPYRLTPIFLCTFISLVIILAGGDLNIWKKNLISLKRRRLSLMFLAIFVIANIGYLARAHFPVLCKFISKSAEAERLSNISLIQSINKIPRDKTMVFWCNMNAVGFFSGRSDIWFFPEYYDFSDFLVIQKDSRHSFFYARKLPGKTSAQSIQEGVKDSMWNAEIKRDLVEALLRDLVYTDKTHDIFRNDDSVLILARKEKSEFKIPSTSLGFGWVKNIPKILKSPFR